MQNVCKISASKVLICTESKLQDRVIGFKSDTAVSTFTFRFLSSSLLFAFPSFAFLSFPGHILDFILVREVFGNALRIVGLDEGRFFIGIFGSTLHFWPLSPASLTESTWFEKYLPPAQVR